jgi:hypothetical protein
VTQRWLEQMGSVLLQCGLHLLDAGVHHADRANNDGGNGLVTVGDRANDVSIVWALPDVALVHWDSS